MAGLAPSRASPLPQVDVWSVWKNAVQPGLFYLVGLWWFCWPLREQARSHRLRCVLSGGTQSSRGYFVWWVCGGASSRAGSLPQVDRGPSERMQGHCGSGLAREGNLSDAAVIPCQKPKPTQPIIIDFLCKPFPAVTHAYPSNQMCNRPPRRGAKGNASPRFRALNPPVKNKTQRCACRIRRVCE